MIRPLALLAVAALSCGCRSPLPAPVQPWIPTPNEAFRATPPALPALPALKVPEVARASLDSGLRLVVVERHGPLESIGLFSRRGGMRVGAGGAGEGELTLAAMLQQHPLGEHHVEASVGASQASIRVEVLADDAALALVQLADLVTAPRLDEDGIERLRRTRIRAAKLQSWSPLRRGYATATSYLYGAADPLASNRKQRLAVLDEFDVVRAREAHRRMFSPTETVIVMVGPLAAERARELVDGAFGGWESGTRAAPLPAARLRPPPEVDVHFLPVGGPLAVLVQVMPVPALDSADYPAQRIFEQLWAEMFTSRLNTAIRERAGDSYGVHSERSDHGDDGGLVVWSAVTDTRAAVVLETLTKERRRISKSLVTGAELARAKEMARAELRAGLTTGSDLVHTLAQLELHSLEPSWLAELDRRLAAVTASRVREVARSSLDHASPIVVCGRRGVVSPQLQYLNARVVYEEDDEL